MGMYRYYIWRWGRGVREDGENKSRFCLGDYRGKEKL